MIYKIVSVDTEIVDAVQLTIQHNRRYKNGGSIFLAGPIERRGDDDTWKLPRWRDEAIALLDKSPVPLVIYTPEWDQRPEGWTYERQVLWEISMLAFAEVLLFWIPRRLPELPGFTTNIEAGEHLASECVVMGAPESAPHTKYLQTRLRFLDRPWYTTLNDLCDAAVAMLPLPLRSDGLLSPNVVESFLPNRGQRDE